MSTATIYLWKGKTAKGEVLSGEYEAEDKKDVGEYLRKRRIVITSIKKKPKDINISFLQKKGVSVKDLSVFTRQFATMVNAGLPLVQCLDVLGKQLDKPHFKKVVLQVTSDVEGGSTLAEALAKHPNIFSDLYVHMISAGEAGGILDVILQRLAVFLEKADALQRKVKGAMTYPVIVLTVAGGACIFMLMFVIPVFAKMFSDFGGVLPAPTRIVMNISDFIRGYWWALAGGSFAATWLFKRFRATENGRRTTDKLGMKIPVLGNVLLKSAVARFTRTLGTLIGSGVPILQGLEITAHTAGNKVMQEAIQATAKSISQGDTIAQPLRESGVFPPMVVQMIGIGEQTGALDEMLSKIADFYDDEVDAAVDALTAAIEPIMIVVMGTMVGGMLVAMYLPMFKMSSVVGNALTLTRGTGRAGGDHAAGPVRKDPNLRLLGWRLALAVMLTAAVTIVHLLGSPGIALPGVLGSLGLLFTSIAVCWAATLAGAPTRLLLACQLSADTVCIGLLVHFTGGPFSAFPLVFCLPIMMGAYYLEARWAMAFAGAAAILTGGGHFGLALGWLLTGQDSPLDYLQGWPVVVTAVHVSVFLVTGMISGGLARRIDRRRHEHAISRRQVQKARWEVRNILDNIRSGLITVDCQGTVTRVNPACCATLKKSSKDMLGHDIRQVLGEGMEDLATIIMPVANGGAAVSRGEVRVERSGQVMPLGLNVNPVAAPDGRCIGAIAIFTDLTREKEMNERIRESDRLAAIGELSASIAHEIRNPLASIRGSVEILAGELDLEGYQSQLLELVLKESARVNTIINDFLAYSRMPAARKSIFNADEFLEQLVLQVEQHVAAKDGKVVVRGSVQPPDLLVAADQGQLTQLALNLAINACEAMEYRGDVTLAMSLVGDGESYEVVVTDDGPGIDPEIREHLFSPFKTTKEGGTGLGLSTAARVASSHGGTLRAEDAPGGGAIFRVRWPREETPAKVEEKAVKKELLTL